MIHSGLLVLDTTRGLKRECIAVFASAVLAAAPAHGRNDRRRAGALVGTVLATTRAQCSPLPMGGLGVSQ